MGQKLIYKGNGSFAVFVPIKRKMNFPDGYSSGSAIFGRKGRVITFSFFCSRSESQELKRNYAVRALAPDEAGAYKTGLDKIRT